MHVMLQNRGTTPLPIGSPDAGGFEGLLPPGLEIALARDDLTVLIFGEQPEPAGRRKLDALAVDPTSPLAVEYGTDIDQWKGRSDDGAETATMDVLLFVKNVGPDTLTLTTTAGPIELLQNEGTLVETVAGLKLEGILVPPPEPNPDMTIYAFTANMDPTCSVNGLKGLNAGDTVTLTATGGDPAAMAAIDGHSAGVYELTEYSFRISNLDLTGYNVVGLAATGAIAAAPVDTTGTITQFTAASPTEATMDSEDQGMLTMGGMIFLEALTGDPLAMEAINGQSVMVVSAGPAVLLDIDLSAVDVSGLTADFTVL